MTTKKQRLKRRKKKNRGTSGTTGFQRSLMTLMLLSAGFLILSIGHTFGHFFVGGLTLVAGVHRAAMAFEAWVELGDKKKFAEKHKSQ